MNIFQELAGRGLQMCHWDVCFNLLAFFSYTNRKGH